ncbi:MAG: aminodeoxychorismate synthase component I, partial [Deefgea sp.]
MPEFNYITAVLPQAPDLLALAATAPEQFPALLQSSQTQGWDILFALPIETRLYAANEGAKLVHDLAELATKAQFTPTHSNLPFHGGWIFYAGYELLEIFEPSVQARTMVEYVDFPLGALIRCPAAILFERDTQTTTLLAETADQLAQLQALLA